VGGTDTTVERVPDGPPYVGDPNRTDDELRRARRRAVAFVVLAVACLAGIVAVVASITDPRTDTAGGPDPAVDGDSGAVAAISHQPHVAVRSTGLGPSFGALSIAPLGPDGRPSDAVHRTPLTCDRVAEAADRGICMIADRGAITTYRAVVFDPDHQTLFTFDLPGEPSRARVSPDGDHGATTVFVSGHSYAQAGFSTSTVIYDLRAGTSLGDLEQFELRRDGEVVDAIDRNYWGVTFADDGSTFYATAATGGQTYLVRGDLTTRTMTTIRSDIECPSLSPDGTRIAFKQRSTGVLGQVEWRLAVLDLASGTITQTAESRSVDDQAAWLDDDTILYGLGRDDDASPTTDVWAVPADGTGAPERYVEAASSPTVVSAGAADAQEQTSSSDPGTVERIENR
jgi:hypothetical protein